MEWSFSLDKINEVAKNFWKSFSGKRVFALQGKMGSGKTTFIHALCEVKGVSDAIGSPTFSLINEYGYTENGVEKLIYHIDLYRLNTEEEAIRAGVEDCLNSDRICLVEWPEKAPGIFPENTIHGLIRVINQQRRQLQIADNWLLLDRPSN